MVSSHGSTTGETNFVTTDKLYLLSTHEVWEDDDESTITGIDYHDTAYHNTRQLDYYKELNTTASNNNGTKKKNGSSYDYWWLRTAVSGIDTTFTMCTINGNWFNNFASSSFGVSPAFRIA